MTEQQIRDKYIGCLVGGAIGDALGYPIEFLKESEIKNKYGFVEYYRERIFCLYFSTFNIFLFKIRLLILKLIKVLQKNG